MVCFNHLFTLTLVLITLTATIGEAKHIASSAYSRIFGSVKDSESSDYGSLAAGTNNVDRDYITEISEDRDYGLKDDNFKDRDYFTENTGNRDELANDSDDRNYFGKVSKDRNYLAIE